MHVKDLTAEVEEIRPTYRKDDKGVRTGEISGYNVTLFAPELRGTHQAYFRAQDWNGYKEGDEIDISLSLKAEAVPGRFGPQSQWVPTVSLVPHA